MHKIFVSAGVAVLASGVLILAQQAPSINWIGAGASGSLPQQIEFATSSGKVGVLLADGPVEMKGHPFFTPLGSNGRACVTCHQPAYGMSFSAAAARELWNRTDWKDPLFAAIDGSNCPDQPQDQEKSHSLLLNRGLIRVFLPLPKDTEFRIAVVSDPPGWNVSPTHGLNSASPAQRSATLLSNGKTITEAEAIAARRASAVADLLRGLGVDTTILKVSSNVGVSPPDGDNRLVSIRVSPERP